MFGRRRHLEEENEQLRGEVNRLLGLDLAAARAEGDSIRSALQQSRQEYAQLQAQLAQLRAQLVQTSIDVDLQEVGVYAYQHPLEDAVAYKARLADLTDHIKVMARGDGAVLAATGWTVNGSMAEGRKMLKEYSKLMLRAYNAEADACVLRVQPHRVHTVIDRLTKVAETIAKLGKTMGIRIAPEYHQLRVQEIRLTADYRSRLEEEKERVREERERQKEERAAALEFEREKARLAKERAHYENALAKLTANGNAAAAAEMTAKLKEIDEAIAGVEAREANIRAGFVYVISNVGAFGPKMVKIGMTRRLEPEDRVRELGDASVPFRFDTHALIFSSDAVGLETRLHTMLRDRAVNKVNLRREFFYATPAEVRDLLREAASEHVLQFHEEPEAVEWRQSSKLVTPST
ncbi:DUF4041 domain-containing protein [Hamadaea tsunoensis]|uniref:DUF4041 domain-containing protein n=1 Tax=Hamadaea tsunoensis TaxID=53368 RepID=UPI00048982EC|nr:DUF4041 domain-containing protein [Hamadaea tsunoensis]